MELGRKICYTDYSNKLARWCMVLTSRTEEEFRKYLGDDLLITYIINNMDINISNYYKWLYSTKDTMSGVNHYVAMDQDGNLYNTNELDDEMKDIYLLREKIQYKLFVDD